MKRILDDLNIFCAVVETGSLKRASERLSVPHSTVSRRIEALEQSLGLTLLHRTTREVKVSTRGLELYQDCSPMLESIGSAVNMAIDAEVSFKGKLNVSMPVRAGLDFLGPWLIDFAVQHSELVLDVSLSNTNQDLIKDDLDLAFRVGPLPDSSAIALHLWDIPYVVCAHRDYVNRHKLLDKALSIAELEQLPSVIAKPASSWVLVDNCQEQVTANPNKALVVDDLALAQHAVNSGQYMAMLPQVMFDSTTMVEIPLQDLTPRTRVMYAYYLGRRHAQSQIKHLISYIKQRYLALATVNTRG